MSQLGDRLLALHGSLSRAGVPHAFGGAIALAYFTDEPRGTSDLDVNILWPTARAPEVWAALAPAIEVTTTAAETAAAEDQVRLWWDDTAVDVFFESHAIHRYAAASVQRVPFQGRHIPILGCGPLVVFKALENRPQDWDDIEAVVHAGGLDLPTALAWLTQVVGPDHRALDRLSALASATGRSAR